jgi:hypothetical protein
MAHMEQQNVRPTTLESEAHVTQKRPYAPPQATFVPLNVEERLLACVKRFDPHEPCTSLIFS